MCEFWSICNTCAFWCGLGGEEGGKRKLEVLLLVREERMSAPHPAKRLVFCSPGGRIPLLYDCFVVYSDL